MGWIDFGHWIKYNHPEYTPHHKGVKIDYSGPNKNSFVYCKCSKHVYIGFICCKCNKYICYECNWKYDNKCIDCMVEKNTSYSKKKELRKEKRKLLMQIKELRVKVKEIDNEIKNII